MLRESSALGGLVTVPPVCMPVHAVGDNASAAKNFRTRSVPAHALGDSAVPVKFCWTASVPVHAVGDAAKQLVAIFLTLNVAEHAVGDVDVPVNDTVPISVSEPVHELGDRHALLSKSLRDCSVAVHAVGDAAAAVVNSLRTASVPEHALGERHAFELNALRTASVATAAVGDSAVPANSVVGLSAMKVPRMSVPTATVSGLVDRETRADIEGDRRPGVFGNTKRDRAHSGHVQYGTAEAS